MKLYSLNLFRTITIVGSSYLRAENIKKGVNIFNVTGTLDYAEYFTGTEGSMLSRWFMMISDSYEESGKGICKFITNGKSLGLSTDNVLRIAKYSDSNTNFCMRIPSYKDYRDIPSGYEFRIWAESPSHTTGINTMGFHMWYWKRYKFRTGSEPDNYPIGSLQNPGYIDSIVYHINRNTSGIHNEFKWTQGLLPDGKTVELSVRTVDVHAPFDLNSDSDYRFSGYVGISLINANWDLYITKITFHST